MLPHEALNLAHWLPPSVTAPGLVELGYDHGFFGCGAPPPAAVQSCRQVHGTQVLTIDATANAAKAPSINNQAADGLCTATAGVVIGVRTADCLPVLLASAGDGPRAVAAVHAGWRGLTSGILAAAVRSMTAVGVQTSKLYAAIGPAISRECYPVGLEVVEAVQGAALGLSPEQAGYVIAKGLGDRWHVDLQVAAVLALTNAGIAPDRIECIQACTFAHGGWHSFRREGKGCGSNWSWIRSEREKI